MSPTIIDRFFSKVQKHGHPCRCWIWTAHASNKGYGVISSGVSPSRPILAHRLSYMMHFGAIPGSLFVCHSCDNPLCVNPEHLWLGTQSDNLHDMKVKGRWTPRPPMRGELHKLHKLTDDNVREIRTTITPQRELAKKFGVSQTTVWRARKHISWPGVTLP